MNPSKPFFKNKKPNPEKLLSFGFQEHHPGYTYVHHIAGHPLQIHVTVTAEGTVTTRIIDPALNEEYILHRVPSATGSFVGAIRSAHEALLMEIARTCFEPSIYQSHEAKKIISYVQNTYQSEPEFLWPRSPASAIFRRNDNQKWYGVLLVIPRSKLGFDTDAPVEILNLKMATADLNTLINGTSYLPGYHMNKKHWCTLCLDGTLPIPEIFERINASYTLAKG